LRNEIAACMTKFLIIRFSSIGDIVLTTPVVRCLKTQVENSEIHYLTKARYASILEANPYIDKIHTLNDNISQLLKELSAESFDYIIDLHRNLRTLRVKFALRRYSFSFNKINYKKWLLVNFKINRLPSAHIVDRYFETTKTFSILNDNKGLDFFIRKSDEISIPEILPEISTPYLIIVVGGGHFTKQIPVNKIVEIIEGLNYPVVLIGGMEDSQKAREIQKLCAKKIVDLSGKLNINQSASLIRQSTFILTPDTGMMHIAAAYKKTIFSVWGNTIPEFGMSPYMPGDGSDIFEVSDLKCRPCSKIGFKKCPQQHFDCMNKQNYSALTIKLNKTISRYGGNF
jgi:ADP-heptose:LPS heptosyltransferase